MLKLLTGLVLAFVAVGALTVWFTVQTRDIACDASFPVWMLEAQDYHGSGCAEELPFWEAPPDADWRMYCTGMCDMSTNPDVKFPRPDDDQ